jgi:hypothetical protein
MSLLLNLPPSQTLSYNSLTLLRHFVKLHRNQHGASVLSVTVADQRKLESLLFVTTSLSPSPLFRSTASLFLLSSGFCFEERGGEVVIVERLPSYVSARQKQDKKKVHLALGGIVHVWILADQVDFLDAASCSRSSVNR